MPNINIKPMRSGGDPLIEFTGSSGGTSQILTQGSGKLSFSGAAIDFSNGLSGSLTKLTDGSDYLLPGAGITLSTSSQGAVTITSTVSSNPGGSDTQVQFNDSNTFAGDSTFTFNKNTDTLSIQNVVVTGDLTVNGTMATVNTTNLEIKDSVVGLGFASGTIAQSSGDRGLIMGLAATDNATLLWKNANSEFVLGRTQASATGSLPVSLTSVSNLRLNNLQANIVTASLGFSGSLTSLADGTPYLRQGSNITVTSASNGAVTISATGFAPLNATYLTTTTDPSISNERVFTPRLGLTGTESSESWLKYYLDINDSVVATISGSTFTGAVKFNSGLSGSLTKLTNGNDYLLPGAGITLATSSQGAITITSAITQVSPGSPTNSVQYNNAGSFAGSSNFVFNGTNVGIGTSSPSYMLEVAGSFAAVTKSFVIDHPSKPGWKLRHGSLEGPENGVYVRGRSSANEIILPDYWKDLVDENSITVQITPIRSKLDYFISSISVEKIELEFDVEVEYCYLIQASRKDEIFDVEFESN
jgi:hypothetical protein